MLPSFKVSDEDIDTTLNVFDEALKIIVKAEREGKVKELIEGEPPIKII